MRSTKIVATIGPSSRQEPVLEEMIRAGMDMARLNFAHGDAAQHAQTAARIRTAAGRAGREVAILGDLPGPKLRIGPVAGGVAELGRGTRVVLTPEHVDGTSDRLPVAWAGFSELVDEGDVCYLADGAVRLRVSSVAGADVVTKVEVGGSVASRQGLNLPNVTVSSRRSARTTSRSSTPGSRWAWTTSPSRSCAGARTWSPCGTTCGPAEAPPR